MLQWSTGSGINHSGHILQQSSLCLILCFMRDVACCASLVLHRGHTSMFGQASAHTGREPALSVDDANKSRSELCSPAALRLYLVPAPPRASAWPRAESPVHSNTHNSCRVESAVQDLNTFRFTSLRFTLKHTVQLVRGTTLAIKCRDM